MTTIATKERPIIFSGPMVRAIMEGRKTMTRRVVKPQYACRTVSWGCIAGQGFGFIFTGHDDKVVKCPYGSPGERLLVRETWLQMDRDGWFDPGKPKDWVCPINARKNAIAYKADCTDDDSERCRIELGYKWKSPLFMPRWASRLTLEITDVRVERLNSISADDAKAEGVECRTDLAWNGTTDRPDFWASGYLAAFKEKWEEINGTKHPWSSNPWVWAISFKAVQS